MRSLFTRLNRFKRMLFTYIVILLIPVILIEAVNFTVMRRQNYDILEGTLRTASERQLSYLNSQFQVLTTAAAQMRKDKNMYYRYRAGKRKIDTNLRKEGKRRYNEGGMKKKGGYKEWEQSTNASGAEKSLSQPATRAARSSAARSVG